MYRVCLKYCPPWPEEMGNRTIKTKLFIERYIQYNLFEPIILIVKGVFKTYRVLSHTDVFNRKIVKNLRKFSRNTDFLNFEELSGCENGLIV